MDGIMPSVAESTLKKILRIVTGRPYGIRVKRRRVGALGGATKAYKAHKEEARKLVHQKLSVLNQHYKLRYGKIAIRNQRSRWGSCSKKGNLNFNFRILLLPPSLQDYIIVHELCHLAVFNHSKEFWSRVAETIPDHFHRRKELVKIAREGLPPRKNVQNVSRI